jgi:rhamnose transport system ATP-binding protein
MALLQLANITKSFGAVRALKGVSFELHTGEIHALLGENGAGKSTLIKIITGAHRPDSGAIRIDGQEALNLTPASAHRAGIACIYQQPALFPDLTVAENIGMRLESMRPFQRIRWKARRAKAEELLRRIGAEIPPDREIRELAMPEQQLVEIACAIGAGARIVIMDEPTASLTQKEQHLLFAVARELRANGVGVIYISHRLEEIFSLADRVTVLRDGESVGSNRLDELNETELIRLMVGREISQIFPEPEGSLGDVVLALRNVSCAAGGISDVSFQVRAGEVLGLAGLVGAGRTELARVLFGITPLDSGEILIRGQRAAIRTPKDAIEHGVAYVPEDRRRHGVILDMTIAANIAMASHRELFPGGWMRFDRELQLASDYIRDLSIKTSISEAPAKSLSGGNQQKVAVARWLATQPKILILDEPTQGVDVGAKSEIHRIIRNLTAQGMAVLMISSDLPEILGMSDRIAVMRGGRIVSILPGKASAPDVMAAAVGVTG